MPDLDQRVRLAAFTFLDQHTQLHGDTLPRDLLASGFMFDGQRVPLLGPQGIFKPALVDLPLSITTVPPVEGKPRPYEGHFAPDGLLRYRYRGTDPAHRDNAGLREAMRRQAPLIDTPIPRPITKPDDGSIVAIPQVGGLHHRYERRAA